MIARISRNGSLCLAGDLEDAWVKSEYPWMLLIYLHLLTVCSVAFLEFYVCFANLFRRFNMSLYKTNETTVQWKESAAARLCNNVKVTVDSLRE